MKNGLKIGIVAVVAALVGAGIVAGVALADGGGSTTPTPAAPSAAALGLSADAETTAALDALVECAVDNGLADAVTTALTGEPSLTALADALQALGACQDEAEALVAAVKDDLGEPADLLRGIATDTAACLDAEGVTLSRIAGALLGDDETDSLEAAVDACLPELPALTR